MPDNQLMESQRYMVIKLELNYVTTSYLNVRDTCS